MLCSGALMLQNLLSMPQCARMVCVRSEQRVHHMHVLTDEIFLTLHDLSHLCGRVKNIVLRLRCHEELITSLIVI